MVTNSVGPTKPRDLHREARDAEVASLVSKIEDLAASKPEPARKSYAEVLQEAKNLSDDKGMTEMRRKATLLVQELYTDLHDVDLINSVIVHDLVMAKFLERGLSDLIILERNASADVSHADILVSDTIGRYPAGAYNIDVRYKGKHGRIDDKDAKICISIWKVPEGGNQR